MIFNSSFFFVSIVWRFSMVLLKPIRFTCSGSSGSSPAFLVFLFFYCMDFSMSFFFVRRCNIIIPHGIHYPSFGLAVERPTLTLYAQVNGSRLAFCFLFLAIFVVWFLVFFHFNCMAFQHSYTKTHTSCLRSLSGSSPTFGASFWLLV